MPSVRVVVSVEVDGQPLPGLPILRRFVVDEAQQFDYEQAGHNDTVTFAAVPAGELAEIQVLLLRSDKLVTLRLDGQSDAGIVINPGGLVLLLDVDVDAGAGASNAKINNPAAVAVIAAIKGFAGGT